MTATFGYYIHRRRDGGDIRREGSVGKPDRPLVSDNDSGVGERKTRWISAKIMRPKKATHTLAQRSGSPKLDLRRYVFEKLDVTMAWRFLITR